MSIWGKKKTEKPGESARDAERIIWLVYWDHYAQNCWLYGSTVSFLPGGEVLFENTGMPPGFPIREWFSVTDYSWQRMEPQLPLLEENLSYHVRAFKEDEPEKGSFLRLNFYDRQGELLGFQMIQENEGSFVCPKGTFRYTLQLVQGGARKVRFRYLLLMEEETWQEWEENPEFGAYAEEKVRKAVKAGKRTVRV